MDRMLEQMRAIAGISQSRGRSALTLMIWTWLISSVSHGAVRELGVAGSFYPKDAKALANLIDAEMARAPDAKLQNIRAIIVPHAGYVYSGAIAASGFRQVKGLGFSTVIVLGPSHFVVTDQASVTGAEAMRTPLGDVAVSPKARELAKRSPFAVDVRGTHFEPPPWAPAGATADDNRSVLVDEWEHSIEVEIPFLQRALSNFSVVPVVMGDVNPKAAAAALERVLDENTLIVVSSDLSHYHPAAEAKTLDRSFVDAVLKVDLSSAEKGEACGRVPILTLMHVARARGWVPHLVDLRNSGDTAGDKSSVVGYAAIVWTDDSARHTSEVREKLSSENRSTLLRLAHDSVARAAKGDAPSLPERNEVDSMLLQPRACFVTLEKQGELRGCIGTLKPDRPLYQEVVYAARAAAIEDSRFRPLSPAELKDIHIEVSVLTAPEPLAFSSAKQLLEKLRPNTDGVVLHIADLQATFLPQVWKEIPDKKRFLEELSAKAGASPQAWRGKDVRVETYQVESFEDP